jgi:hypothetical protein
VTKLKKSNILRFAALNGKAYEIIKRALLQGEIEGGAFLSQDVAMHKYGIGRTPPFVKHAIGSNTSNFLEQFLGEAIWCRKTILVPYERSSRCT